MQRLLQYVSAPVLLFILLVSSAHAQQPSPQTHASSTEPIATVNIKNTSLSQQGNTLTISFDLTNRVGIQTGVGYAVQVISRTNNKQTIVDQKTFAEKVTLAEHSSTHKQINYSAPSGLKGEFSIVLVSKNDSGFPFAVANIGKAVFATTEGLEIQSETCALQVAGEKNSPLYALRQGVDIRAQESLSLVCAAVNSSNSSVTVTPQFETHYRTMFGAVVQQYGGNTAALTFKAQEKKNIQIELPKAYEPQAYDVSVTLKAQNISSNTIVAHYVLAGASATLHTVSLDKNYYAPGDQAVATFVWSPSADSFPGARQVVSGSAMQYKAQLKDGVGTACAEPITGVLSDSKIVVTMAVAKKCSNPKLAVTLTDASGMTLAQKEVSLESKSPLFNPYWLIAALVLLVGAVLAFFLPRTRKSSLVSLKIILPFIALCALSGMSLPLHQVKADTFCSGGYHNAPHADGVHTDWDNCLYFYTANIDKDVYAPGEQINTTGSVSTSMCDNETANGLNVSSATLDGSANYSNESHNLINTDVSTLSHDVLMNQCGGSMTCRGDSSYGSASFTVPNSPGSYVITMKGTGNFYDASKNANSSSGSVDLPFTVSGPACAANTDTACNSAANGCGQTTTGSIQCDGSCSAAAPAQCCPAGKVMGSGGTCVAATCPTGKVLNSSGVCVPVTCPTGQTLNTSGACVPIVCPSGQTLNDNGECVAITCPPGQTLNSSGTCVAITCPTGKILNASGVCVANNCPANQTMNTDGVCVAGSCQSGQILNSSGQCVAPNCPSGQVLNSNGVCIPNSCPTGQTMNSNGSCVAVTCPSGQVLNSSGACVANNSCVANAGQTCASVANSCGMTNIGVTACNGSCSVSMPADSLCSGGEPTLSLVASPNRVRKGTATLLSWNATNVKSCKITGTNGFSSTLTTGSNVNSGVIDTATVFTFTCTSNSGVTSSISQTVQPLPVFNES